MAQAIYAYGSGLCFALGGLENLYTEPNAFADDNDTDIVVSGMIVYNTTSGDWYNVSTKGENGYSSLGSAIDGSAHFVPSFGPAGLLFVLGGMTSNDQSVQRLSPLSEYVTFESAYMYEPLSRQWQAQQVSGDFPPELTNPCVVGVQGEDSYEVRFNLVSTARARRTRSQSGNKSLTTHVLDIPLRRFSRDTQHSTGSRLCICSLTPSLPLAKVNIHTAFWQILAYL